MPSASGRFVCSGPLGEAALGAEVREAAPALGVDALAGIGARGGGDVLVELRQRELQQQALGLGEGARGALARDVRGAADRRGVRLRVELVHEADLLRRFGGEWRGVEQQPCEMRRGYAPRQQCRHQRGHEAESDLGELEARVGRRDHEIACGGQAGAAAKRGAVHGGDREERAVQHGTVELAELGRLAQALVLGRFDARRELLEVGAGTEVGTGAGKHDRPLAVVTRVRDGGRQLPDHGCVERVAAAGTIERHNHHDTVVRDTHAGHVGDASTGGGARILVYPERGMGRRLTVTLTFFLHLLRDLTGTLFARLRRSYQRHVLGREVYAVGVDIFPFFERMTGVGWYEWNLLSALPELDEDVELRLYAHTFAAPDEPSPPPLPTTARVRFRYHHMPSGFVLPVRLTLVFLRAVVEPLLLFLDGNDVYFAPNFFVPRRHSAAVKALVPTVHDLAFLSLPETVQHETLDNLRRHLPQTLFAAERVIAVSAATAADLVRLADVRAPRVHVIHEGVDPKITARAAAAPAGLPARYVLFVSTLEPRKNVLGLLDGFARAVALGYDGGLVLVGRWGWHTEAMQAALAASPVGERIVHVDYLEREELAATLRQAEALIMPSLLEGFGLPIVEAMACGVPVIASKTSSLPEVAGEAALYVDPARSWEIGDAIVALASDPGLHAALSAAGRARATRFRWEDAASATAAVLRRVAGLPERFADAYRV